MTMSIFVTKSSMPSYEEYCEEIKQIWDNAMLTNMGPVHNKFKAQLKDHLKLQNNIELFVNGHLALYCAIKVLGLTGEVITTPFTFSSTTNALIEAGCTPVYCDVKPDYTIDETKIESLITDKTSAILAVHVYGNICNVKAIEQIAKKHNLKVIYDSAHTFGVEYEGRSINEWGDMSMLSFHATKVFNTIEGGALCFKDPSLSDKIARQKNFGIFGETLDGFGGNAKMNEFQAAMGLCNLRHIDDELASRKEVFERYSKHLTGVDGLKVLPLADHFKQNYSYYPMLVDADVFGSTRDEIHQRLRDNDVFSRKYFYPLASENTAFESDMTKSTPMAKYYSRNVLCLPIYAHLSLEDVDRISAIILNK